MSVEKQIVFISNRQGHSRRPRVQADTGEANLDLGGVWERSGRGSGGLEEGTGALGEGLGQGLRDGMEEGM